MNEKRSAVLVFWTVTMMSFVANLLISTYKYQNYFHHELRYYMGSFLASSTIGAIITIIIIMMQKRIHRVSN